MYTADSIERGVPTITKARSVICGLLLSMIRVMLIAHEKSQRVLDNYCQVRYNVAMNRTFTSDRVKDVSVCFLFFPMIFKKGVKQTAKKSLKKRKFYDNIIESEATI